MTDEEISTYLNKLAEIDPELVPAFLKDPDNFDFNQLEGYSDFTDKYKNVADFLGDKNKIMMDLYKQFDGVMPGDARIYSLSQKYPWLNKEELQNWFDRTNKYREEYKAEREREAGKIRREQEIKERNMFDPRSLLSSDYEVQRYIDDPNSAIFGKEAPGFIGSSAGAKADLISGILAGAGDFVPGAGALVGPTVRLGRDVAHIASDSPYQKSGDQLIKDIVMDYGLNAGAWKLANARKAQKVINDIGGSTVQNALDVANETKNIQKGALSVSEHYGIPTEADLEKFRELNIKYPHNDMVLKKSINDMPPSELKTELQKIVAETPENKPLNRQAIQETTEKYVQQTNPLIQAIQKHNQSFMSPAGLSDFSAMELVVDGKPTTMILGPKTSQGAAKIAGEGGSYMKAALNAPKYDELTNLQKLQYRGKQVVGNINKGNVGQVLVEQGYNLSGRGSEPKLVETALRKAEKEATIDRLISNYSLLWNKNSPPPEAKDSPIIKAAWEKWSKE